MNRRQFLKTIIWYGGTLGLLDGLIGIGNVLAKDLSASTDGNPAIHEKVTDYYRIVVLGDPHLPVKLKGDKIRLQEELIKAKNEARDEINTWKDVNYIAALGDICGRFGNEEEYAFAKEYFSKFSKPMFLITGNHDYICLDTLSPEGKPIHADADTRQRKLNRFKSTFEMSSLYYSRRVGRYVLIFLSVDSLESNHLAHMSNQQVDWLCEELKKNPDAPTIIFFHAPLLGTLLNYKKKVNTPSTIANPAKALEKIIEDNQQIILWVSGHTHTPATNPSYASSVNIFGNHVLNLHNTDMDREVIWTNSLYLYPERITIKTFNHKEHRWLEELERTIQVK